MIQVFGSKAIVYLKHNGGLKSLAKIVSEGLVLPEFYFESDMDPPHQISALCETLGFEIWIEKSDILEDFPFVIKIESKLSFEESFNNQMYDLSPWLARYISKICEIDSCIYDELEKSYIKLTKGIFIT
ncbi:MAG: hypothetical protein R2730_07840 [Chitinophagales bacterium]